MSVPVRAEPTPLTGAALDAAREALAPRLRSGDWDAFVEFFALSGVRITWSGEPAVVDPD